MSLFPINALQAVNPSDYPVPDVGWCDGGLIGHNGLAKIGICSYATGVFGDQYENGCQIEVSGAFAIQSGEIVGGSYAYPGADMMTNELPEEYNYKITNNQSEYMAMLYLLMHLPDGWSGKICCDSKTTIGRYFYRYGHSGIHEAWQLEATRQLNRLGKITPVHVNGHGDGNGWRSYGNVLCDNMIRGEAAAYCARNNIDVRQFIRPTHRKAV